MITFTMGSWSKHIMHLNTYFPLSEILGTMSRIAASVWKITEDDMPKCTCLFRGIVFQFSVITMYYFVTEEHTQPVELCQPACPQRCAVYTLGCTLKKTDEIAVPMQHMFRGDMEKKRQNLSTNKTCVFHGHSTVGAVQISDVKLQTTSGAGQENLSQI